MNTREITAIKQAILMEIEGYEFYRMAQTQFDEPEVKKAFGELMEEEKMHAEWLKEVYDKMNAESDSNKVLSFLEVTPEAKIFDWDNLMQKSAKSPLAVFGIALELEKSSMDYYQSQANASTSPDLKQLFEILTKWEKSHYSQFDTLYAQLKEDWWADQNYAPF